ncbi:MAG: N-6 DNA methylase [Promethearchaeota archaeon]
MVKIIPNEHSIRAYWRDILIDLLKGKNIEIIYDPTIKKEKGQRYPDFFIKDIKNDKIYILETKLGDLYYTDAVVDGIEKMLSINADASIAVAFPESLKRVPINNLREAMDSAISYKAEIRFNTKKYTKNKRLLKSNAKLSDLNNFILDLLLKESLKEKEELDIIETIHILREDVLKLYQEIKILDTNDVKSLLGGRTLFENVLGYGDEELENKQESLFYIIAYLLLNQLLFYNIIQKYIPSLPKLTTFSINKLEDIRTRFIAIRSKDWEPVFGYDIISLIIETLPNSLNLFKLIRYILQDIEELTLHDITNEILGILFHELIPLEIRKVVAAYYTGNQAGELLAWLSIDDPKIKVLDPACGSGSLLTAAYRRKRYLLEKEHPFTANDHKQFVEKDIVGIDIMPFATHLSTINLSLQAPISYTNSIRIGTEDSTKLHPGMKIHQTFDALKEIYNSRLMTLDKWVNDKTIKKKNQKIEKGPISLNGKKAKPIQLSTYDLVIMNPPFTRAENIAKIKFKRIKKTRKGEKEIEISYKDILYERFNEYRDYLDASMGLFGYFILLADRFLNKNGKIAAVLPASILRLKSTLKIRKFITENYNIEYIITRKDKLAFSENTALREILLIMQKKNGDNDQIPCKYVSLITLPNKINKIHILAENIKNGKKDQNFNINKYTQNELKNNIINWYTPIFENEKLLNIWNDIRKNPKLIGFKNLLPEDSIIRGVESPNICSLKAVSIVDNKYASNRDIWIFKELDKKNKCLKIIHQKFKDFDDNDSSEFYTIPTLSTLRALRTPAYLNKLNTKDLNDYIIVGEFPKIYDFLSTALNKPPNEINLNFLTSWLIHCESRVGHLFHSRRVNLAAPGTKLLGFYSSNSRVPSKLFWTIKGESLEDLKILSLWFNSSIHLLQIIINRIETGGAYIEIGKYSFNSMYCLDLNNLNLKEKQELLELFDKVKDVEFPSILKQLKDNFQVRVKIDDLLFKILGYTDKNKRESICNNLRKELYKEIISLKKMMR